MRQARSWRAERNRVLPGASGLYMRRRARTDGNHTEIRTAFRKLGYSVADTSRVGDGFPDLVISLADITALVEVKDGQKPPSARKLTPDEKDFRAKWKGLYFVVESLDDVVRVNSRMTREWSVRLRGIIRA